MRSLAIAASIALGRGLPASTPPAGFADQVLLTAITPTGIAYEPGTGALFVLEKGNGSQARVLRRDAASGNVTTALTLDCVDPIGERGLLGIAFDPAYASGPPNRLVYLYYTRNVPNSGTCAIAGTSGSRNRVSRFTQSGGTLSGEMVVLEGPVLDSATNHNGGTVRFAADSTLYVSMGDNNSDADVLPYARDLDDLRGKILRVRRDGTIPPDNPFVGQAGKRPEVWAWGLRNPFRFSIDSATQTPWIGDVGEDHWEEIDAGAPGADYGWPCFEANAPFRTCTPPPVNPVAPALVYGHPGQSTPFAGNTVIGGPVYRSGNFPAAYEGRLFFGDYGGGWIRSAAVGPGATLSDVQLFVPDAGSVVDLAQAPSGCLAWADIGSGRIHETCYTAASNRAPVAVAGASPTSGTKPLAVQFSGAGSSDPDGDVLSFAWTFGDGGTSNQPDPLHTYSNAGVYTASLTVDDEKGAPNSKSSAPALRIVSGNRAPAATIDAPPSGARYDAGDVIAFSGHASDPEDGVIPASGLGWSVVFHHDTHTHPFLSSIPGVSSGSFTIPDTGEDSVNVWYRIHLTATDSGSPIGPGGTVSDATYVDVQPNLATITLAADPPGIGLSLTLDGTTATAPQSRASVVHFRRTIGAPSPQTLGPRTWAFHHWTDAVAASRTIAVPPTDTTYTAVYRCAANCIGLPDEDGDGVTVAEGDCNDRDSSIYPGAPDLCDRKNNDCTGSVDDATCEQIAGPGGRIDGFSLSLLGRYFGLCDPAPASQPWAAVDFTKDGCLDGDDLAVMGAAWGCSGLAPLCK